ncbi:MAG: ornithine cyclodeaminase family protein [Caldilineaceae bacterium SB0668_bin_21]|nr:ornithine cyclodeaminase family protein [Caldilineaceae bacterium SB0668_bin_21]MYC24103.1 ornithine cyclodeaminase family protein [Caldilineaceae bacterium SB0662_bin_25]
MPLWLTRNDVENLLDMQSAIEAVGEAFRLIYEREAELPVRANIPVARHEGSLMSMPAYLGGEMDALGAKLISFYGTNPTRRGLPAIQGNIVLFDGRTGALLALMDAGYLTAMRTGASGGVATRYLAKEDARTLTIFGSGVQAPYQVEAALCERAIERVLVLSRTPANAEALALKLEQMFNISAQATVDVKMAVEAADILVTATSTHEPLFDGSLLRPGVHISGIGSHLPYASEVDASAVQRAKVVVDQMSACLAEAGDLIRPIEDGVYDASQIHAEIGAIIAGDQPGREGDDEITFFKSVGLAAQDVAVARVVYAKALAQGAGTELDR